MARSRAAPSKSSSSPTSKKPTTATSSGSDPSPKPSESSKSSSSPQSQSRDATNTSTDDGRSDGDDDVNAEEAALRSALTSLMDIILVLLCGFSVANAWRRQFEPVLGSRMSSSPDPGGFLLFDLFAAAAVFLLGGNIPAAPRTAAAAAATATATNPFPSAPWTFLACSLAQPLQHSVGGALPPSFVHALEAVAMRVLAAVVAPALVRTLAAFSTSISTSSPRTQRAAGAGAYLAVALLHARAPRLDPLGAWLVPTVPYEFLPQTWLVPFVVGVICVGRALLRFRALRQEQQGAGAGGYGGRIGLLAFAGLCAVPILHGLFLNSHSPLPAVRETLDGRLREANYTLIARGDGGPTGYVSVIRNNEAGFKVMRCGHSLLGGVWEDGPGIVKEPIYAVFMMLEAVRLMVPVGMKRTKVDSKAHALAIGLGVGTAPAAFIHHGINTTIVELDGLVYQYALDHFELPREHTAVIGDAVGWVDRVSQPTAAKQYDYILHDVFTGGVEPAELFTYEFLSGLRRLLKDNGSIAINYAGDVRMPTPTIVLRTILAVFENCKIFREIKPSAPDALEDQTNIVVYCRKDKRPWEFAKPEERDYLGTHSRRTFLVPEFEVDQEAIKVGSVDADRNKLDLSDKRTILWNSNLKYLQPLQEEAGKRHWELMRGLLPRAVWVNW